MLFPAKACFAAARIQPERLRPESFAAFAQAVFSAGGSRICTQAENSRGLAGLSVALIALLVVFLVAFFGILRSP